MSVCMVDGGLTEHEHLARQAVHDAFIFIEYPPLVILLDHLLRVRQRLYSHKYLD